MRKHHAVPNSGGAASSAAKIKDTCGYTPKRPRSFVGKGVGWVQLRREVNRAYDALCERKSVYRQFPC